MYPNELQMNFFLIQTQSELNYEQVHHETENRIRNNLNAKK